MFGRVLKVYQFMKHGRLLVLHVKIQELLWFLTQGKRTIFIPFSKIVQKSKQMCKKKSRYCTKRFLGVRRLVLNFKFIQLNYGMQWSSCLPLFLFFEYGHTTTGNTKNLSQLFPRQPIFYTMLSQRFLVYLIRDLEEQMALTVLLGDISGSMIPLLLDQICHILSSGYVFFYFHRIFIFVVIFMWCFEFEFFSCFILKSFKLYVEVAELWIIHPETDLHTK